MHIGHTGLYTFINVNACIRYRSGLFTLTGAFLIISLIYFIKDCQSVKQVISLNHPDIEASLFIIMANIIMLGACKYRTNTKSDDMEI